MWKHVWLGVAVTLVSAEARAFGEDVCYTPGGGGLYDCLPLPDACKPAGTTTPDCYNAALTVSVQNASASDGGRSSVHSDSTYVLARAAGFGETEAYWIAAYDEAIDLGQFTPRDMNGTPLDAAWSTAQVTGLVRTSLDTGGVFFHFLAPTASGTDGLHPDVDDANVEVMLAHLRAWVGNDALVCADGLTTASASGDYATGPMCYAVAGDSRVIHGQLAAFNDAAVPFSVASGPQTIVTATDDAPAIYADGFDDLVGGEAERPFDARLGIYVHALADRISHHVCTDASVTSGPTAGPIAFEVDMSNAECVQTIHVVRHMWETGVAYESLDAKDRTTEAALTEVFEALIAFANQRGIADPKTADPSYRTALTASLSSSLELEGATARVTAIANVACANGWTPFKGAPACAETPVTPAPEAPATATDAATDAATDTSTSSTSDGGCASAPVDLWAAALALFALRSMSRACGSSSSRRFSPSR